MFRLTAFLVVLAVVFGPGATAARAEDMRVVLERQLAAQGYDEIRFSNTWLGRLRVEARDGDVLREIVVNPNTGEILRDFAYRAPQRNDSDPAVREPTQAPQTEAADEGPASKSGEVPDLIDPKDLSEGKSDLRAPGQRSKAARQ